MGHGRAAIDINGVSDRLDCLASVARAIEDVLGD
jgi:hypothetical protein